MIEEFQNFIAGLGMSEMQAIIVSRGAAILAVALIAYIANFIVKRIIVRVMIGVVRRTKVDWDDPLADRGVFTKLSHLAPALVIGAMAPAVFSGSQILITIAKRATDVYMLIIGIMVINAFLDAINDVYQKFEVSKRVPIRTYTQVIKIGLTVAALIFALSIVMDKEPWVFLSGIGALTAVLLLVFKDTLLGFVASIQLVAHGMVRPGDWIEMPKYGADGDVMEITLNTVKVQNFDKTITTIPTYALISDSFKNWRGMSESGGRRIKRSIHIDVNSIQFSTPEMVEKFSKIEVLRDYIERKQQELRDHNEQKGIDESVLVNGRRMTNVGTFRAYLIEYLRRHPKIHNEMTFLVRQLQPTDKGLPIELYVFSNDKRWVQYEDVQADIFDHIFASLPEFGLRPFQSATGHDIAEAAAGLRANRTP
jgi:miniconductance mechanosensitive channel